MHPTPDSDPRAAPAGTLDGAAVLARYARHWPWLLLSMLAALGLAFLFLRVATPRYGISSKLLIRGLDKDPYRAAANPAFRDLDIFNASTNLEDEIEALKSRQLLQEVLTELGLNVRYYAPGTLRDTELFGRAVPVEVLVKTVGNAAEEHPITLYLRAGNTFELADEGAGRSRHRFGEEVRKPYGTFTVLRAAGYVASQAPSAPVVVVHLRRPTEVAEEYSQNLTVEPANKKSSVLQITLLEAIPAKGTAIVTKLVEVYNRQNKEDRNALAINTIRFIDDRLESLSAELSAVERKVGDYKSQNAVTDVTTEAALYGAEVENNSKRLADNDVQISILGSLTSYLRSAGGRNKLVPSNLGTDDPTLLSLVGKFNELQLERERMLRTTEASNPLVLNMDEQLTNLRRNILENIRNIQTGLGIARKSVVGSGAQANANIRKVPTIERRLLGINRQQGVKQSLYQFLLQKREESALSLAATGSNTRLVEAARVSEKPVKPLKPLVYLVAMLAGLLLPLGLISLRELWSDRVDSRAVVHQHTAVPVLGTVPHLRASHLLPVAGHRPGAAAEAFQVVRHSLLLRLAGGPSQVLLVSAGRPNQGQTVVALNLAASLGMVGKTVAVLDFNLRTPHLGNYVPPTTSGLTNYLTENDALLTPLLHDGGLGPNVRWIGAGPLPSNPTETLASPRVAGLFAELKTRFDHIIVLTAPVGQVADAFLLAPFVDACLFVVRFNHARLVDLGAAETVLTEGKFANPLLILNDVLA